MSFKGYKDVMNRIVKTIGFTKAGYSMNIFGNDENSLNDPYSKVTHLVIYLFSMEFGQPPLYAEVNRVCR